MQNGDRPRKTMIVAAGQKLAPATSSKDVKRRIVGKLLVMGGTVEDPASRKSGLELPVRKRGTK